MNAPALSIEKLGKSYGKQVVLRGLSLDLRRGESFGLVGMNGAGKTTLIKCLLDFCAIDDGRIEILGVSHRETRARKPLAYLPENFMPPYYLTGRDFLKYLHALREQSYSEQAARAMFEALDLDASALDRIARNYSKGMTQKLGLAACFLSDADLFVLDEPMSGLDPKARALVKRRLAAIREAGKTLFFSSHVLADVEEMCDRMAILHEGELRFVGTPSACRESYGTETLEGAYLACIEAGL
jgi:ABC-2 type transport system ATP-binding protein